MNCFMACYGECYGNVFTHLSRSNPMERCQRIFLVIFAGNINPETFMIIDCVHFRKHVVAKLATLPQIDVTVWGYRFRCPYEAPQLEQCWYGATSWRFLSIAVIASDDAWVLDAINFREKWWFSKMSRYCGQHVPNQWLQVRIAKYGNSFEYIFSLHPEGWLFVRKRLLKISTSSCTKWGIYSTIWHSLINRRSFRWLCQDFRPTNKTNQTILRQDGNAAIQESIGDAIFMAMMVPQHLNRLQLLSDQQLFAGKASKISPSMLKSVYSSPFNISQSKKARQSQSKSPKKIVTVSGTRSGNVHLNAEAFKRDRDAPRNEVAISKIDLSLLLHMALLKIPQIPFQYIMDIFRWNLFNETISMDSANTAFWNLATSDQGIHPPDWENRDGFFDAGAKFHVADNTPFVRWMLPFFSLVFAVSLTQYMDVLQILLGQLYSSTNIQGNVRRYSVRKCKSK